MRGTEEHRSHVGALLGGKYRLLAAIGRGGFATVYRAEHTSLGIEVAVKVHVPSEPDREAFARFAREARALAALRSRHIVRVVDHGVEDDVAFLVMDLLEGETLAARLERVKRVSPEETLRVLTDVGRGLAVAHGSGIVHRDLKPENIFLTEDEGGGPVAKIVDFGVAKRIGPPLHTLTASVTRSGVMLGTPAYMSPEQAEGTREVDHRSDLWAMGAIAFECLTGERLFKGTTLGELVLQICAWPMPRPSSVAPVPGGFDAWFERAMARDVGERFVSADALVDALARALEGAPAASMTASSKAATVGAEAPRTAPPGGSPRGPRWSRSLGARAAAAAAAVLVIAVLAISSRRAVPAPPPSAAAAPPATSASAPPLPVVGAETLPPTPMVSTSVTPPPTPMVSASATSPTPAGKGAAPSSSTGRAVDGVPRALPRHRPSAAPRPSDAAPPRKSRVDLGI